MSKRTLLQPAATPVAQLLTIAQVATLLCVHRTKVYDHINHHGLPVMKLGSRSTRINAVKLQQWIEQREQIA
jgi:excisionase family DNA binding protein